MIRQWSMPINSSYELWTTTTIKRSEMSFIHLTCSSQMQNHLTNNSRTFKWPFHHLEKHYRPHNKPYSTIPELNRLCFTAFCFHFMFILYLRSDTSQHWLQHLGLNTDFFNPTQSGPTLCMFGVLWFSYIHKLGVATSPLAEEITWWSVRYTRIRLL